jgi:hypothetical protein
MKRLTKSERRKQIRRFDAIRDDQINTTDIPEITEEQMAGPVSITPGT